jgi:uncharacterized secreted protein with C-terminal beta-propeller domain
MRVRVLAVVVLVAATAAPPAPAGAASRRARAFASCAQLASYAKRFAARPGAVTIMPAVGAPAEGAQPTTAPEAPVPAAAPDYSQTNVQEAGIDEPDLVKTDGSRVYAIAGGALHAIAARGAGAPRLLGSLKLDGADHQLLLHGDRVLVISREAVPIAVGPVEPGAPQPTLAPVPFAAGRTLLTEVDVSDPAAMRVVHTLSVEGDFLDAREHGGTARVVLTSAPIMAREGLAAFRPSAVLRTPRTGRERVRPLVPCRSVRRPVPFAGVGTLTILTIDLDRGLPPVDVDALMTSGETVYASADRLYVATERWIAPDTASDDVSPTRATTIHDFDVTDPDATTYRASGAVRGYLLNQFALSAFRGRLRAATTALPGWLPGDSESSVTVLDERGDQLVGVGSVGGLGRGQRIYAVRFLGDTGYVVTFRQIDPLYTLDLSDPAEPRVMGELELLGYSAYLHPLGGDLLLGVGQDATTQGRPAGAQVSLFDVSDLRHPVRLDHRALGENASAAAEFDHHAFLYWAPTHLAVLPLASEALGLKVTRQIEPAGRLAHPGGASVQRALVIGDRLLTLSDEGVMSSDLDTLRQTAWLRLAGA